MSGRRFAEFFAGVGLVRLGLEAAGWECVFANDHDPKKAALYTVNFPEPHPRVADVGALKPSDVPDIDLATASFPCTDLSLAGKRAGLAGGGESASFYSFMKLIRGMKRRRPRMILLENVPGLLTSRGGADILSVLTALNAAGYGVDMFTVDARWFVPQSRRRLFVLARRDRAQRKGEASFRRRGGHLKPAAVADIVASQPAIGWTFAELPEPPRATPLRLDDIVEPVPERAWWARDKIEALVNHMSPKHRKIVNELAARRGVSYRSAFRRVRNGAVRAEVRSDGISGCLRPPRGGSSRQILIAAGDGALKARWFTAREYARLQGVADGFRIPERQSEGLFGFGDAVCVPVIRWIGERVLTPLVTRPAR